MGPTKYLVHAATLCQFVIVQVATWLDAVLYNSSYRPVLLQEHVKDGTLILDHNNQVRKSL
jgi:hypothetical protein